MSEIARVDVWTVESASVPPVLVTELHDLLTPDERARGARLVRLEDRHTFVVARALVRTTLSRYGPTPPRAWRFVVNEHQCPFVDEAQAGTPRLYFNLSHTDGLVALAVSRGHRVGVDVERVDRVITEDIAGRHFAPSEVGDLHALPPAEQPRAFFEYWTLKEAYIKARGLGLALPLDRFAFTLRASGGPVVRFDPGFDDEARWQFWQAWPTAVHRLSLAVEREGTDLPVSLHVRSLESLRA